MTSSWIAPVSVTGTGGRSAFSRCCEPPQAARADREGEQDEPAHVRER